MRAFEINLNGRKLCVAGIPEPGVVTTGVTWVTGPHHKEPEDMELRVGGLVSRTHTHVNWLYRALKEGDEIKIVVLDRDRVSKPRSEKLESEADRKKRKLAYLKHLSKELGYEIKKKK